MKRQSVWIGKAAAAAVLGAVCVGEASGDVSVIYDASSGLLPSELCWNDFVFQDAGPQPFIEGDALRIGPTTYSGNRGYQLIESPFVFDDGVAVDARVRIISSTYGTPGGFERAGYLILVVDDLGRWASLEIGESVILLRTINTLGVTAPVETTAAFRDYRLEFDATHARAIVDGNEVLTLALGTGLAPTNSVSFGDLTILGNSESLTERLVITIGETEPCPPDINRDGSVDLADLNLVLANFGSPVCVDATGDGLMNLADLNAVLAAFGTACPG